jgi:Mn2+/Fe2+ NRAMP family transporter
MTHTAAAQAVDIQTPPRSLLGALSRLGPGMIIAGSVVGSGELILTTKVGAEAGFWLLWLIIIGCVIKVSTQIEFARHTITWGDTPLKALNAVPGPRLRPSRALWLLSLLFWPLRWLLWFLCRPFGEIAFPRVGMRGGAGQLKVNWVLWYWTFMTILVVFQQGGILGGVGQTLALSRPLTAYGAEYNRVQGELVKTRVELNVLQARRRNEPRVAQLQQAVARLTAQSAEFREPRDPYLWAALLALATSILLYLGRYGLIQIVATTLVATFTLVTVLTVVALQLRGEWAIHGQDLIRGLSFHLPPADPGVDAHPMRTAFGAFGIIGIGAAELIRYPYWCLEKGYAKYTGPRDGTAGWVERARGWIRVLHVDAWSSMVVYTFATLAFYLLGAAVLGRIGLNPAGKDMVRTLMAMYIPVFGPWGNAIFLCGAFAVLYSTLFVAAAGNARMVADALGLYGLTDGSEASRVKWTRRISAAWPFLALLLYAFVRAPSKMIVACGIAQSIMLPLLGAAALYFRYRRSDSALRPGRLWDALLWTAFLAFLVVGAWSVFTVFVKS